MREWAFVIALAVMAGQLPAKRSVWVLQPPDRIVEYDVATFNARRTISVPPRVIEHPRYLAVNAVGQLMFAAPAGMSFGGGVSESANLVWMWDGRATREWERDDRPESPRQWFLSAAGNALFAWETRLNFERDANDVERAVHTATRLLRTDLSGGNVQTLVALSDLPSCACPSGACSETCPVWKAWVPHGVLGDFLLATRFVEGQLQADFQQSIIHWRQRGGWATRELPEPVETALDASSDGRVLAEMVHDAGCCGWINESSDRLVLIRDGKTTVLYDEWIRFDNRNYDASFTVSDARFDRSRARLAYTIVADAPNADEEIRLSSDGKSNAAELARIRRAASELPAVEIVDINDIAKPRVAIAGAALVGWIDADTLLVVHGGRLAIYDRRGQRLRDSPILVRSAADVFFPAH